jgi:hypothetical protein
MSVPPLPNAAGAVAHRHPARLSRRTPAAHQGIALPARSAHGRGDRRGHAPARPGCPRRPPAGADGAALARRAPHPGGTQSHRARSRAPRRVGARPPRQRRQPPRGRHRPWGLEQPRPRPELRASMPVGPLPSVIDGATRGRPVGQRRRPRPTAARRREGRRAATLRAAPAAPRPRRRALPRGRRSTSLNSSWDTPTSAPPRYPQGTDNAEIIATVHARKAPMIPASTRLVI